MASEGIGRTRGRARSRGGSTGTAPQPNLAERGVGRGLNLTQSLAQAPLHAVTPAPGISSTTSTSNSNTEIQPIPDKLLDQYFCNRKNPISCIMEYAILVNVTPDFRETRVQTDDDGAAFASGFAVECVFGGRVYPQGTGKTKKEAKTNAARAAFQALVERDIEGVEVSPEEQEVSKPSPFLDKYELGNKNPIMMLGEYCSKTKKTLQITVTDQPMAEGFMAVVIIEGGEISKAFALNKKDAKTAAADEALKLVMGYDMVGKCVGTVDSHYDATSKCVLTRFAEVLPAIHQSSWRAMAAFIIKRADVPYEMVAMGTGESLTQGGAVNNTGYVLLDCHALTVAKRALLKYLLREVMCVIEGTESIFTPDHDGAAHRLKLKPDVNLHLYCNFAPNGDGYVNVKPGSGLILTNEEMRQIASGEHTPVFDDENSGQLRTKIDQGATTIRISTLEGEQTWDDIVNGNKLRVMSNSDKILKWNVCGVQGSLLSHIVEPVYLNTITLGSMFSHGHMTRAVCCRAPSSISAELPTGYRINHPYIGRTTHSVPVPSVITSCSINWSRDDGDDVEVVDAVTGKIQQVSPEEPADPSWLCKAAQLFRFRELCKQLESLSSLTKHRTYRDAKQAAIDYQQAKTVLYKHMKNAGYGTWIRKPPQIDNFTA